MIERGAKEATGVRARIVECGIPMEMLARRRGARATHAGAQVAGRSRLCNAGLWCVASSMPYYTMLAGWCSAWLFSHLPA